MKEDLSKKELVTHCQTKEVASNEHKINIISFVDYSTKYGLGYLINNRTYGVYFNDSSLMSIDGDKKYFFLMIKIERLLTLKIPQVKKRT